jgi:hypothetical protein
MRGPDHLELDLEKIPKVLVALAALHSNEGSHPSDAPQA